MPHPATQCNPPPDSPTPDGSTPDHSIPDQIEREIVVAASLDRVWQVLTEPSHVGRWFGQHAEFDLRAGAPARFGWDEHGWFAARIEQVVPPTRFVFRWAEDADTPLDAGPSTLVEFTLTAEGPGSTRVRVVESGFAQLPPARRAPSVADHLAGWHEELADLVELLAELDKAKPR